MQKSELGELAHHFDNKGEFMGSSEENKIIDSFILKNKGHNFEK